MVIVFTFSNQLPAMDISAFEELHKQQLLPEDDLNKIKTFENTKPVSVHWDLLTLLYLGIFLLTTGVGILIYKNIDSLGHGVILTVIALAFIACLAYCFKKSVGFTFEKANAPNVLFDYVLLTGCLLFIILIGYLQFQYNVFGDRWGMATFIPMIFLFFAAYYFDHLGVLSLAITNLAAWVGISITPLHILNDNDFSDDRIILSGIVLGGALIGAAILTTYNNFKKHFAFTYKNFGTHILFVSLLAALFHFEEIYLIVFLVLVIVAIFFYRNAIKERSFYFLVLVFLYSYIALSYVIVRALDYIGDMTSIYLGLFYFILSGIGLIRLLMYYNKNIKA